MREIKFRAWHIGNAKMYMDIAVLACPDELFRIYDSYGQEQYIGNDKHCEIMQYTGLKDKNGVEIYEGDIVACRTLEDNPVGAITWSDYSAEYKVINNGLHVEHVTKLHADNMAVIGNIYENPELLNKEGDTK